ncbi:MAG: DNA repair protein RecO C-terminal domain-containing protein [Bacteroidales bacterium]|nr:DNA repair protein RecO C-terminal domain-containing protein [Candidatus Cryptobacteroides aphodequi]
MNLTDRVIVLRVTPLRDNTRLVHTISREWGRRSFIIGSSRNSALYLPLNILEIEVASNAKSELWRIRNASACLPLNSIRNDRYKTAMALFMSEVLYRTVTDGACEPGLFEWCEGSIVWLDALEGNAANWHLRWLLELCSAFGFAPSVEQMAPFAGEYSREINALLSLSAAESLLLPLTGEKRSAIARCIIEYLSCHLEAHINIRSLDVFSSILQ